MTGWRFRYKTPRGVDRTFTVGAVTAENAGMIARRTARDGGMQSPCTLSVVCLDRDGRLGNGINTPVTWEVTVGSPSVEATFTSRRADLSGSLIDLYIAVQATKDDILSIEPVT